jgi:hypothetical protein
MLVMTRSGVEVGDHCQAWTNLSLGEPQMHSTISTVHLA